MDDIRYQFLVTFHDQAGCELSTNQELDIYFKNRKDISISSTQLTIFLQARKMGRFLIHWIKTFTQNEAFIKPEALDNDKLLELISPALAPFGHRLAALRKKLTHWCNVITSGEEAYYLLTLLAATKVALWNRDIHFLASSGMQFRNTLIEIILLTLKRDTPSIYETYFEKQPQLDFEYRANHLLQDFHDQKASALGCKPLEPIITKFFLITDICYTLTSCKELKSILIEFSMKFQFFLSLPHPVNASATPTFFGNNPLVAALNSVSNIFNQNEPEQKFIKAGLYVSQHLQCDPDFAELQSLTTPTLRSE
ncbi:MAG: hypothetical protein A3E85_03925 [Gammaproteobacteria bacterium RIFCSPHIGHO2_12_FULL_45_12]|nr:MAG: hypothetical protein A3E85_03925 [Gammaproteobacteria bacterium RIFCSPHIGHO2_12_FULL_45_12]